MDTRHFLLAEHYDSLGLYKVADSLDSRIITSQSQAVDELIKEKEKQNNFKKQVENYTGPASLLFLSVELNTLSKEATQHYLLKSLKELASTQSITPSDISKIEKILAKVRAGNNLNIPKPILEMLEEASQGIKPSLSEVNALIPKNPNIVQNTNNFLSKIKSLASKNPSEAALVEDVAQKIGTKIPAWQKLLKVVPLSLVLLNAYFLFPAAKQYFTDIKAGKINEIWNDPSSRAQFVVFLADVISSVTIFFPPLAALSSALAAISIGYQGGMYAFDRYNELTGNQAKDTELNSFIDYSAEAEEQNIFDSDEMNYTKYVNSLNIEEEAKYALKLLIPEIGKILISNLKKKNRKFKLKTTDLNNLPVLYGGVFGVNKKGQIVQTKAAPGFLKDSLNPENQRPLYDFNSALPRLVEKVNMTYPTLLKREINRSKRPIR
jgi:hypothetical protein